MLPDENGGPPSPSRSWWSRFVSLCRIDDNNPRRDFYGNLLEFLGTAIHISSDILVFVAGLGFFVDHPIKKMYSYMLLKNLINILKGSGQVCIEGINPASSFFNNLDNSPFLNELPQSVVCYDFEDQTLFTSATPFNFPYPDSLFTSSASLLGVGTGGFALAYFIKQLGASLHKIDKTMPPTEGALAQAKKWKWRSFALYILTYVGSRTAEIYASATISLTNTLQNIPDILSDFPIHSRQNILYNASNATTNQTLPFNILRARIDFITYVNFSELREGAKAGGKVIAGTDYYVAIAIAAAALGLGYASLKAKQSYDSYNTILLRQQHAQELLEQLRHSSNHPAPATGPYSYRSREPSYSPSVFFSRSPRTPPGVDAPEDNENELEAAGVANPALQV